MSKRYTETELEKIIRIGCARIDQAVEQVCAKYEAPQRYSNRWLHDIWREDLFIPHDFWPKWFADQLVKDSVVDSIFIRPYAFCSVDDKRARAIEQMNASMRMRRICDAIDIRPSLLVKAAP